MSESRRTQSRGGVSSPVRPVDPRPGVDGCVIDGHMHVMSGNCTPLPTVWYNGNGTEWVYRHAEWIYKEIRWEKADPRDAWGAYLATLRTRSHELRAPSDTLVKVVDAGARAILMAALAVVDCISSFGWYQCSPDSVEVLLKETMTALKSGLSLCDNAKEIADLLERKSRVGSDGPTDTVEAAQDTVSIGALVAGAMLDGTHADNEDAMRELVAECAAIAYTDDHGELEELKSQLGVMVHKLEDKYRESGLLKAVRSNGLWGTQLEGSGRMVDTLQRTTVTGLDFHGLSSPLITLLRLQKRSTERIASLAVMFNHETNGPVGNLDWYPMVALGMDMDYAHLDGYKGRPVYEEVPAESLLEESPSELRDDGSGVPVKRYQIYRRTSADSRGEPELLNALEGAFYEDWPTQVDDTIEVVRRYPWQILPLYHYDPRRWQGNALEPFRYVVHKKDAGEEPSDCRAFVGFKVYPALGYKPADPRLPDFDEFYLRCTELDIPIVTHCSPGGLANHHREFFYEYDCREGLDPEVREQYWQAVEKHWQRYNTSRGVMWAEQDKQITLRKMKKDPELHRIRNILYFQEEYGSARAWRPVLDKHPGLRLCLAHFGGRDRTMLDDPQGGWDCAEGDSQASFPLWNEEIIAMICGSDDHPNLYTDISYFFAHYGTWFRQQSRKFRNIFKRMLGEHPRLRDRILFGTDWYMIEREDEELDMRGYCRATKELLLEITEELTDEGLYDINEPDLWVRFAVLNPFRFYQIEGVRAGYSQHLRKGIQANAKKIDRAERAIDRVTACVHACRETTAAHATNRAMHGAA